MSKSFTTLPLEGSFMTYPSDKFFAILPLEFDNIVILPKKLGVGSAGEIYKGYFQSSKIMVVVKKLFNPIEKTNPFMGELLLKNINHEFIPKFYDKIEHEGFTYLILGYFEGMCMIDALSTSDVLSEKTVKIISRKLLNIINYLHNNDVCHRDIKMENIIVGKDEIYLIDFGYATDKFVVFDEYCGSVNYCSPQILTHSKYDPKKNDVWSFGVLLYYLVFGDFPYDYDKYIDEVNSGSSSVFKYTLTFPNDVDVSNELINLFENVLRPNEDMRWSVSDILNCEWFAK